MTFLLACNCSHHCYPRQHSQWLLHNMVCPCVGKTQYRQHSCTYSCPDLYILLQDLLTRHKPMVAGYLSRNYDQVGNLLMRLNMMMGYHGQEYSHTNIEPCVCLPESMCAVAISRVVQCSELHCPPKRGGHVLYMHLSDVILWSNWVCLTGTNVLWSHMWVITLGRHLTVHRIVQSDLSRGSLNSSTLACSSLRHTPTC